MLKRIRHKIFEGTDPQTTNRKAMMSLKIGPAIRAVVVTALLALVTTACSTAGSESAGNTAAAKKDVRVGYISFGESIPYVHTITQSLTKAAASDGVEFVVCDSETDPEKALQCAIRFKQQNVQGIVNYQGDATAAERICKAGPEVPVIAITVHQKPCEVSWTGADNLAAGKMAGEGVGKYFKDKFNCEYDAYVSVEVKATGKTGLDRMGGYLSGFESVCGKVHGFRSFDTKSDAQVARKNMIDTLTAIPDAKRIVVVGANDAIILGALSAAASANRVEDVFVSAQGLDSSGVCGMRKYPNQWIGDTAYFPEAYGDVIIPAIVKAINGETLPKTLPAKLDFLTPKTVEQHYADVKC